MTLEMIALFTAGLTIAIGAIGPALGEGRAAAAALDAMARQPDLASSITRTLFVSLAMIESTAIYCLLISMLILFKIGPIFEQAQQTAAGQ